MERIVLTALLLSLVASTGLGLTLDEAVTRAITENPVLIGAEREWKAAEKEKTRVTSLPDPMIEFGFGQSRRDFDGIQGSSHPPLIGLASPKTSKNA